MRLLLVPLLLLLLLLNGCPVDHPSDPGSGSPREKCTPGLAYCDGDIAKQCSDGGFVIGKTKCQPDQVCFLGAWEQNIVCQANQAYCVQNILKICNEQGTAVATEQDCGQLFCANGVCTPATDFCPADQAYCEDNTAHLCNADGTADAQTPQPCGDDICVEGVCQALVCDPGTAGCVGTMAYTCNIFGTGHSIEEQCQDSCINGRCGNIVCTPGSHCNDNILETCNPQGTAVTHRQDCAPGICEQDRCVTMDAGLVDSSPDSSQQPDGAGADNWVALDATADASTPDTVTPDASAPDAWQPDSWSPDTWSSDTWTPDTASPDIWSPDTASPDRRETDASCTHWQYQTVDDGPGNTGYESTVAVNNQGQPAILYNNLFTDPYVAYAVPNNQGGWDIEKLYSDDGNDISFVFDDRDQAHVSFSPYNTGQLVYAFRGSSWELTTVDSPGRVGSTAIALTQQQRPVIAYVDISDLNQYVLRFARLESTGWQLEVVDASSRTGWLSMALDSQDHVHLAYTEMDSMSLKYARHTGTGWIFDVVDSNGETGNATVIAIDSQDQPHIIYGEQAVAWEEGNILYAYKSGYTWVTEHVHDGGNSARWHTQLVLDAQDTPHILFPDDIGYDMSLVYAKRIGANWTFDYVDPAVDVMSFGLDLDWRGCPFVSYKQDSQPLLFAHQ